VSGTYFPWRSGSLFQQNHRPKATAQVTLGNGTWR